MSRARDLADAGSKANFLDNVSADINTTYAPLASPNFTGDVSATNIKHASSGSNNLVLVSDGTTTVSGALTASGLVSLSNGINGVRTNQNTNSTEIGLTGSYQDVVTTTITPKSANSKLLVLAVFSAFTATTNSILDARIKLTATGHTTSYSHTQGYMGYQAGTDTQLMINVPINYIFTVSNTNLYTIALEAKEIGGTANANYDDANSHQISELTVLEI